MRMIDDMYEQGRIDLRREQAMRILGIEPPPRPVPVAIDNVAAYVREQVAEKGGLLEASDYPYIVSPWPRAFFEYGLQHVAQHDHPATRFLRLGALVTTSPATEREDETALDVLARIRTRTRQLGEDYRNRTGAMPRLGMPPEPDKPLPTPKWLTVYESFTQELKRPAPNIGLNGVVMFALDEEGQILEDFSAGLTSPEHDNLNHLPVMLAPVFMACSFLHARNITTETHRTPEKVAKKRRKSGKPVGETYRTIVIDPMKRALANEGNIGESGIKKALHLVRGHFRTYTKERPLFGKYTGTVWVPFHARGSQQQGRVEKDYVINAPQATKAKKSS